MIFDLVFSLRAWALRGPGACWQQDTLCTHPDSHTYISTYWQPKILCTHSGTHINICVLIYMYSYVHIYICVLICTYIYMCVCEHAPWDTLEYCLGTYGIRRRTKWQITRVSNATVKFHTKQCVHRGQARWGTWHFNGDLRGCVEICRKGQ